MPEISRFFGISIKMFYGDHAPPHFQTRYAEYKSVIDIQALVVIRHYLPPRVLGMVIEWASQHQGELLDLWERAASSQSLYKVPPLE